MERKWGMIWGLMSLIVLICVSNVSSLSLTVTKVECLYEQVRAEGDMISGNFVVVDRSLFFARTSSIDFTIASPGGDVIHTLKGSSGDKFEVKAPKSGIYTFCFRNKKTRPETVSFHIHIGHIPNEQDVAKDEHVNPINVKIAELREALASVAAEQKYLKARDDGHRETNESTRQRVIGYTVGEYVVLTLVSLLQVIYIRRLFSKSAGQNRV